MTGRTDVAMLAPLVPADCDVSNFMRMPLAVGRLLASNTWIAAADDPRLGHALISLWSEAWRQVPAGSLPDIDKTLARLSMCPTADEWQRVRERALDGWVRCSDGRLYHPTVCEMALEGWIEKLAMRTKGARGNKTRWGTDFDEAVAAGEIRQACEMLRALNPNSALLQKKGSPVALLLRSLDKGGGGAGPMAGGGGGRAGHGAAGRSRGASAGDATAIPVRSHSDPCAIAQRSPGDRTAIPVRSPCDRNGMEGIYPPTPLPNTPVDNFQARGFDPPGTLPRGEWWLNRPGVEAAGGAVGIGRWDEAASQLGRGEHWLAYRDRVFIAAGDGPWLGQVQGAPLQAMHALQPPRAGGVH